MSDSSKKCVLLADDDPAIARLVHRVLREDYDVVVAVDGSAAVNLAKQHEQLDLLILDVMMPVMDGLAVARAIRAMRAHKAVPIIFLTAKTRPDDVIRGIQAGARHYLTKPFKIEDLLSKVKKVLNA